MSLNEHPILWKVRTRWAAVGAAVAVVAGAGGIAVSGATNPQVTPSLTGITPCRIMDTRSPGTVGPRSTPLGANTTHTIQVTGKNGNCSLPSDTALVMLNVTLVSPAQGGFITVFPAGAARPNASNLNYVAGQAPTPNQVTAALSSSGQLSFYASAGPVNLIADVVAYTSGARMTPERLAQRRWDLDRARPLTTLVGPRPADLLYDGTTMWVANSNFGTGENGSVSRVDAVTGVKNPTDITVGVEPVALAYDGTRIWVANKSNGTVSRITASTGAKLADVIVGSVPVALAYDGTNIWVANEDSDTVSRINPGSGAVTATVPVGDQPSAVLFDGTYIWVANKGSNTLSRITEDGVKLPADIAVNAGPNNMVFDGQNLIVAHTGTAPIAVVDRTAAAKAFDIPVGGEEVVDLLFDGSDVWALRTSFSSGSARRVDLSSASILTQGSRSFGSFPVTMEFDGTNFWANTAGDSVMRVRAR